MKISMNRSPDILDWAAVKRRALITVCGKGTDYVESPPSEWRHKILKARHSPIRYLRYSFLIEDIPSNTATHLCRHVHAQPYVSSLRNDRQDSMDGDAARRDTPVNMILDVNAEELMVIANKRLCMRAAEGTREAVKEMCRLAEEATPELKGLLVPMCEYAGECKEMKPCGKKTKEQEITPDEKDPRYEELSERLKKVEDSVRYFGMASYWGNDAEDAF